ncbi:MAG: hypothetical protein KY463_04320 [Actinobacteria bacterium]|nr:hypothetical protein [Actinomycetota bacterium]
MIPGLPQLTPGAAADLPQQRAAPQAGLGFERLLLGEMARAMTESAGLAGGAAGILADQLPDVLADAVVAGGGIGLAATTGDEQREGTR